MKKTILLAGAFATILFLSECAEKKLASSTKKETPAEEVTAMKTKYTADQIAQGKVIYNQKCGECHDLHAPAEFTVHEWDDILPGMSHKAKLSSDDAGIVRSWVITNAKAG